VVRANHRRVATRGRRHGGRRLELVGTVSIRKSESRRGTKSRDSDGEVSRKGAATKVAVGEDAANQRPEDRKHHHLKGNGEIGDAGSLLLIHRGGRMHEVDSRERAHECKACRVQEHGLRGISGRRLSLSRRNCCECCRELCRLRANYFCNFLPFFKETKCWVNDGFQPQFF